MSPHLEASRDTNYSRRAMRHLLFCLIASFSEREEGILRSFLRKKGRSYGIRTEVRLNKSEGQEQVLIFYLRGYELAVNTAPPPCC